MLCGVILSFVNMAGFLTPLMKAGVVQGWKLLSCCHCQELCQQASWPLIGSKRVNNQSEASKLTQLSTMTTTHKFLLQDDTSVADWRNLFLLTAGISAFGVVVFTLFARAEVQSFNTKDYRDGNF